MNRRGFLGAILATATAPAIVSSGVLMPVRKIWTPAEPFFAIDEGHTDATRALRKLRMNTYYDESTPFDVTVKVGPWPRRAMFSGAVLALSPELVAFYDRERMRLVSEEFTDMIARSLQDDPRTLALQADRSATTTPYPGRSSWRAPRR